jgi:hypothetical protein
MPAWYRLAATMRDDPRPLQTAASQAPSRLYPRLLGAAWDRLPPAVQRVHTDDALTHAEGVLQVSRAPGRLTGLLLDAARVPPASRAARVRLTVEHLTSGHTGPAERWCRVFERCRLVTVQTEAPGGLLAERIGLLEFRFRLAVKDGAILFRQQRLVVCLGPVRLPLPHRLAPQIAGREAAADDGERTKVEVRVTTPGGSLLFSYHGAVRWTP